MTTPSLSPFADSFPLQVRAIGGLDVTLKSMGWEDTEAVLAFRGRQQAVAALEVLLRLLGFTHLALQQGSV